MLKHTINRIHIKMILGRFVILCLLVILPTSACFAVFNFNTPISIQSDHLEYNHQTGIVTHKGHVVVKQGNKILKADSLLMYNETSHHALSKMVAKGSPQHLATFQGKIKENQPLLEGQALTISYFPKTQKLLLEGNALLKKEQDTFTSPTIQFDLASNIVTATKDEHSRPTLVIYKNVK